MKRILPCVLCIVLLLFGSFYWGNIDESQQVLQGQKKFNLQLAVNEGIQIVAKRSFVGRGEIGVMALKCTPNVNCKIVCNYKVNGKNYTATRNILAGKDGSVLCTWKVDKNTDIGSYEIEITSGGSRMVTSYMVQ